MDSALHCPTCGYNLTGLPENRCPECGASFSPRELRTRVRAGFDNVSLRAMMFYLLSAPAVFALLNAVCRRWDLPKLVRLSGTALVVAWALANSIHWAMKTTELEKQQQGRRLPWPFLRDVISAMILQFIIGGVPFTLL